MSRAHIGKDMIIRHSIGITSYPHPVNFTKLRHPKPHTTHLADSNLSRDFWRGLDLYAFDRLLLDVNMRLEIRDILVSGADRINVVGIALTATIGVAALIIAFLTYRIQQARSRVHDLEAANSSNHDLDILPSSTRLDAVSGRSASNLPNTPSSLAGTGGSHSSAEG